MQSDILAELAGRLAEKASREGSQSREAPTATDATEDPEVQAEGETPDEAEAEGETEATETEANQTPEEILSVADFAKAAGWEPSDLYKLNLKLDNGEELPLGQVKDKLQEYARDRASIQEQQQQLAEQSRQLQAQAQEYFSQRTVEGEEAQKAHEAMLAVQARYDSVDWDGLAKADPGRAALLQQQMAADYAGAKQQHSLALRKEAYAAQQFAEQQRAQHAQALLQAVPEWKDPAKAKAEITGMQQYLHQWFKPEELGAIFDWRANMLARKAWLYDQEHSKMAEVEKTVRSAPKPVLKPGTGQVRGAAQKSHEAALVKKARESGRQSDKDAAASAILRRALGG